MLDSRILLTKNLLGPGSISCYTIDDFEFHRLRQLISNHFGDESIAGVAPIRNNPSGRSTARGFSIAHEYAIFFATDNDASVGRLDRNEKQIARYDEKDEKGSFEWVNFRKHGGTRDESPKMFFPFFATQHDLRLPSMEWNEKDGEWTLLEKPKKNEEVLYPIDDAGQDRRWKWGIDRVKENLEEFKVGLDRNNKIAIYVKTRINEEGILPLTWWDKKEYSATSQGTNMLKDMFGQLQAFSYPKSIHAVEDCLKVSGANKVGARVLDYFAGSGTTGHAIINMNREDSGARKYTLIEMGDHFGSVLKPRMLKAIYSSEWKSGKPTTRRGVSQAFKYLTLESYEDALNNLAVTRQSQQTSILEASPQAKEDFMLNYLLDVDTRDSKNLLGADAFIDPSQYSLRVSVRDEVREHSIDLVETFNYLIGLHTKTIDVIDEFKVIQGLLPSGDKALIIWRNAEKKNNEDLNKFFEKQQYNTQDFEFDRIYVNGDNNLENLKVDEDKWKVILIEEEFKKRMFEDC